MTFVELSRALRSTDPLTASRAARHIATLPAYLLAAWIEYTSR